MESKKQRKLTGTKGLRSINLLYHDIVQEDIASSGFPGVDAAIYKLDARSFEDHVHALKSVLVQPPASVWDIYHNLSGGRPITLTFDDGGSSGLAIAEILQRFGWIGHFFITTDFIGHRSFLDKSQIREIRNAGHLIGSHSCSHPLRMADLEYREISGEWDRSLQILAEILGEKVEMASVPGGYYSRRVAAAASRAGVRALFTSEPVCGGHRVDDCLVLGRFCLMRGTPPWAAVGICSRSGHERAKRYVEWNCRKVFKKLAGRLYSSLRIRLLKSLTSQDQR
jgi:peptidoglycan/xylan/chitin deacetylase (PgdA/CDA1 family)